MKRREKERDRLSKVQKEKDQGDLSLFEHEEEGNSSGTEPSPYKMPKPNRSSASNVI